MNTVLTEQVGAVLDDLRDARTYKRFLTLESPQGPVVRMEGRGEVIVLSRSNTVTKPVGSPACSNSPGMVIGIGVRTSTMERR